MFGLFEFFLVLSNVYLHAFGYIIIKEFYLLEVLDNYNDNNNKITIITTK